MNYGYRLLDSPTAADINGLREAYQTALMSDDPSTQVGACCGTHRGFNKKADLRDAHPEDKGWSLLHAEVRCILGSARSGMPCRRHTMYAPWACCVDCASHILDAGIPRVVVHHQVMQLTPERWQEQVRLGLDLLLRNNVAVDAVSKKFGVRIRFSGDEVDL